MKRSYDYSFAQEDRDHTFTIPQHSFEHIHTHAIATQAAPYHIGSSAQAVLPSPCFPRAEFGQHTYLGLRSPLLNIPSGIDDDFQSNAAVSKVEVSGQGSQSRIWATYGADSGTTGLGILCGGLTHSLGYTLANDTLRTNVTSGLSSHTLDALCSPVPGGFLELLTWSYAGSPGILGHAPTRVEPLSTSGSAREDATTGDSAAFVGGNPPSLPSVPSLLYPSSSELAPDPLFCSSDSESSVEGTLVGASLSGLYPTSSTEVSANNSPVRKSLFYASSSSGSVDDNPGPYSVKDAFPTLLNLDSPLLGLGSNVISVQQREPVVGLYADVNLRTVPTRHDSPEVYVNPVDVMGQHDAPIKVEEEQEAAELFIDYDAHAEAGPGQDSLPATDSGTGTGFTEEAVQAIVDVISAAKRENVDKTTAAEQPRVIQPKFGIPTPIIPQPTHFPFAPPRQLVPVPVNLHPSLRNIHAPAPPVIIHASVSSSASPRTSAAQPPRGLAPRLDHAPYTFFPSSLSALQPPQRTPLLDRQPLTFPAEAHASPVPYVDDPSPRVLHPLTPICNAHMGVELDELRRRADTFRARNPGADIDKAWLQAFAGRLSESGVLIDEWRCYVKGCAQRNKRRDHILVHVGSHVEHRPFACGRWYVFICSGVGVAGRRG